MMLSDADLKGSIGLYHKGGMMIENFIPDYSKYETEFLVDIYARIDRENNPLKAQALDNEIKKRFNLSTETEIDARVVNSFINISNEKSRKVKTKLSKSEEMIRQGWIAGLVIGSITFLSWLIAILANQSVLHGVQISYNTIIDILMIFGLSYGISRKSRVCAITLTGYFILAKLIQILTGGFPIYVYAFLGLLVFGTFFVRAAYGTFKYHSENFEISSEIEAREYFADHKFETSNISEENRNVS